MTAVQTQPQEFIRSFTPDLEVRSAGKGGDGRTIEGIAVPYAQRQRITPELTEQFARGAFNHQLNAAHRVRLARDHVMLGGTVIGKAIELRDDAAGLWGAWRVSATPVGDETLTLVRDGVLDELSVGFRERQNRVIAGGVVERVKADLFEVSVVLQGAYGQGAAVTGVRQAGRCALCGHHVPVDDVPAPAPAGTPRLAAARQLAASLPTLPV